MRKYPETKAVAGSQKLLNMMETSMNSGACFIVTLRDQKVFWA